MLPAAPQHDPAPLARRSSVGPRRLVEDWLSGRKDSTRRAYGGDLRRFADWLSEELGRPLDPDQAAAELLALHPGDANALVLEHRHSMQEAGLAPATINRRLAALRSLVALAQLLGVVGWTLRVQGLRSRAYRDTRGPGRQGFLRMLERAGDPGAPGRRGARAARDRAMLRLLYDLALRCSEVVGLDLEHLDLEAGTVEVLGKGREERELLTLPGQTRAALAAWVERRGDQEGALFAALDRPRALLPLSPRALYKRVRALGKGIRGARPHGLRHSAITDALELTGGDVRQVRQFSRHASLRTLQVYDDAREDLAGRVAARVAGAAGDN